MVVYGGLNPSTIVVGSTTIKSPEITVSGSRVHLIMSSHGLGWRRGHLLRTVALVHDNFIGVYVGIYGIW